MLTSSSTSSFLTFNGRFGVFLRERIACCCCASSERSSGRSHGFVVFHGGNRERSYSNSDASNFDSVAASNSTGSSPSFSASPRTSPSLRSRRKTHLSDSAFHLATPMVVKKNFFSTSFSSRSSSSCHSSYPLLWSQRGRRLLGDAFQFRFSASSSGRKYFSSSTPFWRSEDPYSTLELPPSATPKEIKDAFYRLSKKYHPDLHPGDKRAEGTTLALTYRRGGKRIFRRF